MNEAMSPRRVQHVSLARPRDGAAAARRFYGEILGLQEIAVPHTLSDLDLIWYAVGANELHLFPSNNTPGDVGQHFCLQVDDPDALRAHLKAAGVETYDDTAIPNRPRFFCLDPFGNRIEFTAILGPYTAI